MENDVYILDMVLGAHPGFDKILPSLKIFSGTFRQYKAGAVGYTQCSFHPSMFLSIQKG